MGKGGEKGEGMRVDERRGEEKGRGKERRGGNKGEGRREE